MKIVIFVDFKSNEFNKDFTLSNALLNKHTVFLVSNNNQLEGLKDSFDKLVLGYSFNQGEISSNKPILKICKEDSVDSIITKIEQK